MLVIMNPMKLMKLKVEPSVPNILTLIRLLAIPVLAYYILAGDEYNNVAFILFASIWATDMLDGWIARHFNQTTEFGKLFDPLVDKIFQLITAIMMSIVGKLPLWVPLFIFLKELLMVIGSTLLLRKKDLVVHARWYGKLATSLFVIAFASLFLLHKDQRYLANYIFIVPIVWSLYAYYLYGRQNVLPLLKEMKANALAKRQKNI
jgi:cardiolipin synthase